MTTSRVTPVPFRETIAASVAIAVAAGVMSFIAVDPAAAVESHRTSWAWADLSHGRFTVGADRPAVAVFPWAPEGSPERESHDVTDITAWADGVEVPVGGTNWVAYGNDFEVSLTADEFWVGDRSSSAATAFLADGIITATVDGIAGNTIVVNTAG